MEIHHLQLSLVFFGLAALVGLYMLSRFYRGLQRRNGTMLLHGLFAAAALGILIYYSAFESSNNVPFASIVFFIIAVFGGLFMAVWDKVMSRKMPRYFPLVHAGAAVTGVVLLIVFMLNHP